MLQPEQHQIDSSRRIGRLTIEGLVQPSTDDLEKRVERLEQLAVAFLDVFKDLGVEFEGDDEKGTRP